MYYIHNKVPLYSLPSFKFCVFGDDIILCSSIKKDIVCALSDHLILLAEIITRDAAFWEMRSCCFSRFVTEEPFCCWPFDLSHNKSICLTTNRFVTRGDQYSVLLGVQQFIYKTCIFLKVGQIHVLSFFSTQISSLLYQCHGKETMKTVRIPTLPIYRKTEKLTAKNLKQKFVSHKLFGCFYLVISGNHLHLAWH